MTLPRDYRGQTCALSCSMEIVGERWTLLVPTAMWHKWVFITTLGAVTSLMRGTVGEVYDALAVPAWARRCSTRPPRSPPRAGHPVPEAERAATLAVVSASGSPMVPSLYRDPTAGRPSEVEHLFGDLTARARDFGVATPLLDLATLRLRIHQRRVTATADAGA